MSNDHTYLTEIKVVEAAAVFVESADDLSRDLRTALETDGLQGQATAQELERRLREVKRTVRNTVAAVQAYVF